MTQICIEAKVTSDHRLGLKLPNNFPVGEVKVIIESVSPGKSELSEHQAELEKCLLEIRQRAIAKGMELKTIDEILAEIRADRGERDGARAESNDSDDVPVDDRRLVGDAVVDFYRPRTELGRRLIELRRAYLEGGGKLMSWDEVNDEVRRRRGGVEDD